MAIYKPSNLSPQNEEIDINYNDNVFECQVNTSGEPVKAYKMNMYNDDGTLLLYEGDFIDKQGEKDLKVNNKKTLKINEISRKLFDGGKIDAGTPCYTNEKLTNFLTLPYQIEYEQFPDSDDPDKHYFKATTIPNDIRTYCSQTKEYSMGLDGYYIETPATPEDSIEYSFDSYTFDIKGYESGIPSDVWGEIGSWDYNLHQNRLMLVQNKIKRTDLGSGSEYIIGSGDSLFWYPFLKDYYFYKIQDEDIYVLYKKEQIESFFYKQQINNGYSLDLDTTADFYKMHFNWWATGVQDMFVDYLPKDDQSKIEKTISMHIFNFGTTNNDDGDNNSQPTLQLPANVVPSDIKTVYAKINQIPLINNIDYFIDPNDKSQITITKNIGLTSPSNNSRKIFFIHGKSQQSGNQCTLKSICTISQQEKENGKIQVSTVSQSDQGKIGILPKDITSIEMIWDDCLNFCLDEEEKKFINLKDLNKFRSLMETSPEYFNYYIKEPEYNGKDYQWNIRTYNQNKKDTMQPNTKVCDGYLTGSTKTVLWSKIPYQGQMGMAKAGAPFYTDADCTIQAIQRLDSDSNFEQIDGTLGKDRECQILNSSCYFFEEGDKRYYVKKSDVTTNKDLIDNIVYDRYVEFETTEDQMNLGYNPEEGKELPKAYPYKERKKIDWVTQELGYNKDIIKVEVIDDEGNGFTYNYYDGTPYKVFTCSDKHTVKSFFADSNQNINVADYVMLYKDKEKAREASYYRQDPIHGCQKSTVPLGWYLYADQSLQTILRRNPWPELPYQFQDDGKCSTINVAHEKGSLYIESPNDYIFKDFANSESKKIIGYSSDTGELRIHDSWEQQPNNNNAYRIFEKNPETGEYLEILDDNNGYMVASAQSLKIDEGFYCFPTVLPVTSYKRFASWGEEVYDKGIPFWKHYDDMKSDLINGSIEKVVFFYNADKEFTLGGHSSYENNGVSTIFWWGYSTFFKDVDDNKIFPLGSEYTNARGNFITWIPRYGDSWDDLLKESKDNQYVGITQGGNYCYDYRPQGVWSIYPYPYAADTDDVMACGRFFTEAAKFTKGQREYWIDGIEPVTNQKILIKTNKGYANTGVYTKIIDKVITINPILHFNSYDEVINNGATKLFDCFATDVTGENQITYTKISPIYSYYDQGVLSYTRGKLIKDTNQINWDPIEESDLPKFCNQKLYIEGNNLLSLTSQNGAGFSMVRLGTPYVRVTPSTSQMPLYKINPSKIIQDDNGLAVCKVSDAEPVMITDTDQKTAEAGHLVYFSGIIETYYPSWSGSTHQESFQWYTYYDEDDNQKYYVLDGVLDGTQPRFDLSRQIVNRFTDNYTWQSNDVLTPYGSEFYIETPEEYYNSNPYNHQIVGGVPIQDDNNLLKVMTHKWGGPNSEDFRVFIQPNINILPDLYKPVELIFKDVDSKITIPEQYKTIIENNRLKKKDLTFDRLDDSQWLLEVNGDNESQLTPESKTHIKQGDKSIELSSYLLRLAYQFLTNKYYYQSAQSLKNHWSASGTTLTLNSGYDDTNITGTNKYSSRVGFFHYKAVDVPTARAVKFSKDDDTYNLLDEYEGQSSQTDYFSMFYWKYAKLSNNDYTFKTENDAINFTLDILKGCVNDIYVVYNDDSIESFELAPPENWNGEDYEQLYTLQTNHTIDDIKEVHLTYSSLFDCDGDGDISQEDVNTLDSLNKPPIIPKSPYTIYTSFMDSMPNAYFYARATPSLDVCVNTISENSLVGESETFADKEYILDGINMFLKGNAENIQTSVHSYQYELYECAQVIDLPNQKYIQGGLIKSSGPIYTNDYTWSFKGLENNMAYILRFTIEDEYNKLFTREYCFFVKYEYDEFFADLQLDYDCHENAIQVTGHAPIMAKSSDYNDKTTINKDDIVKDKDYSKYKNRYLQINNDEILHYNCTNEDEPDPIYIPDDFSYLARFQICGEAIKQVQGQKEIPIANINYDKNEQNEQIDISLTSCYQYKFNEGVYGKEDHPLNLKIVSSESQTPKYFDLPELFKQFFVVGKYLKYAGQPDENFEAGADECLPSVDGWENGDRFLLTKKYKVNNRTYYPGVYQISIKEGSTIKQWVDCQDSQYIFAEDAEDFEDGVIPSDKTIGEFLSTDWEDQLENSTTWGLQNSEADHVWAESENNIERLSQVFDNTWFTLLIQRKNDTLTCDLSCDTQSYNI